jgi:hypothetical protein
MTESEARAVARQKLIAEFPEIVESVIKKAKATGSYLHLKSLCELAAFDMAAPEGEPQDLEQLARKLAKEMLGDAG